MNAEPIIEDSLDALDQAFDELSLAVEDFQVSDTPTRRQAFSRGAVAVASFLVTASLPNLATYVTGGDRSQIRKRAELFATWSNNHACYYVHGRGESTRGGYKQTGYRNALFYCRESEFGYVVRQLDMNDQGRYEHYYNSIGEYHSSYICGGYRYGEPYVRSSLGYHRFFLTEEASEKIRSLPEWQQSVKADRVLELKEIHEKACFRQQQNRKRRRDRDTIC